MHTRLATRTHPGPFTFTPSLSTARRLSRWTWGTRKSDAGVDALAGTVPFHNAYILLHTRQPPPAYPAKVPSALQRALLRATLRFGGQVNFAWAPEQRVLPPPAPADDSQAGRASDSTPGRAEWDEGGEEAYCATAFSRRGGRLEIPAVSAQNMDEVVRRLEAHAKSDPAAGKEGEADDVLDLYVCTHGERDCRCKEHGCAVYDALRAEVRRRGLEGSVRVAGVGHVGGHKYAANLLVYPYGEWFGNLRAEHVPEVLDALLAVRASPGGFDAESSAPLLPQFWRGRIGLDKEEQLALFARFSPASAASTPANEFDAASSLRPHVSRK